MPFELSCSIFQLITHMLASLYVNRKKGPNIGVLSTILTPLMFKLSSSEPDLFSKLERGTNVLLLRFKSIYNRVLILMKLPARDTY